MLASRLQSCRAVGALPVLDSSHSRVYFVTWCFHDDALLPQKRITSPKAQKYLEMVLQDLDLENKGKDVTREELRGEE
jgi:hypothetical protein